MTGSAWRRWSWSNSPGGTSPSRGGWRAAEWLTELGEEGVVRNIGVTNFDCGALTALLDAGIPVISNQVQFSLLDRRAAQGHD